ncbi:MAG TPA: hypothetical protein VF017_12620 [Thermoanaerobaculia bacterium]|nr:hypothetical protein [Thermoanaerobaculia bacterium]
MKTRRSLPVILAAALILATAGATSADEFSIARIYIEYNQTANDLGYHVTLDGEDWKRLEIENPREVRVFLVQGYAAYRQLGMTELFFEGAEPNLDDFPLEDLLALFPEGFYEFDGLTVDNLELESVAYLSHAIPNGPGDVTATLGANNSLVISWDAVTTTPDGFPDRPISIAGYQLIVKPFQVTVPANVTSVTVPPEFVATLPSGVNLFEVLAIDESGNQSITESSFVKP